MASIGTPSEATREDAAAIAALFASSWTSAFTVLQLGYVDPNTLTATMEPRIVQQMAKPDVKFIVTRDLETQKVVSVAQWTLPEAVAYPITSETPEQLAERQAFEDELFRSKLPESCNKDLKLAFYTGLRETRERLLKGQKYYHLGNLSTHPDYRGKGLASKLVEWGTSRADAEGVPTYLDTSWDNPAIRMYERLGFEKQGESVIDSFRPLVREKDLERYGGDGSHTHVAFIRQPVKR